MRRLLTLLALNLLFLTLLSGCDPGGLPPLPTVIPPDPVIISENGQLPGGLWYDIYFTDPACPPEEERIAGVDEIIAADILQAERRIDIATFDLDSLPIINALIALEDQGIEARVVVDNEHTPAATVNRLRRNGISVVEDQRSALMHNKFIVIDGYLVWTGSLNFTSNGVYCNNNNIVRLESPRLAANYVAEMDEMYIQRQFGPKSPENTINQFNLGGILVENYFSADDDIAPIIARVLARADQEILVMAFSFTNEDIGDALLERAEAGLSVRGVFETSGAQSRYSYFADLSSANLANVELRLDGNPRVMHHKVFIVDREIVIFGSYNFSGSAEDANDENILIIHDPEFSSYFVEEFEIVWLEAE